MARYDIWRDSSDVMNYVPHAVHVLDNLEGGETKQENEDDSEDEEDCHEPLSLLCESHVARSLCIVEMVLYHAPVILLATIHGDREKQGCFIRRFDGFDYPAFSLNVTHI